MEVPLSLSKLLTDVLELNIAAEGSLVIISTSGAVCWSIQDEVGVGGNDAGETAEQTSVSFGSNGIKLALETSGVDLTGHRSQGRWGNSQNCWTK